MSQTEKELHASNAKLKDAISNMEKELHASNAKLRWLKYKLEDTER